MMSPARRCISVLVACLLVTGCLTTPQKSKVEKLPNIDQKVGFYKHWNTNVGSGQGKLVMNLAPTFVEGEAGKLVVASDHKGRVYAVDAQSGRRVWFHDVKVPLSSAVGTADNLVLVGGHKADVVALDKNTGFEQWRTKVSTEVLAGPVGRADGIAVLTIDSRLHGLNPKNGADKWLYDSTPPGLKLRGGATPLVIDDMALVGFANGQAGLFDLSTGRTVWLEQIAQPHGRNEIQRMVDINGRMVKRGNMAYIVTFQGKVAAVDTQNLQVIWTRDASSYTGVAVSARHVIATDANGKLTAFDRATGETQWIQDVLKYRRVSAPVITDNYVIVADQQGDLTTLSLTTGELLGYKRIGSAVTAPPLLDSDGIILQTTSGKLVKFSVASLES